MIERHAPGMEELPGQTLIGTRIALTVERIAHAGVVDMAHVQKSVFQKP